MSERIREWFRVAGEPAWARVPDDIKALFGRVCVEAREVKTTGRKVEWTPGLREAFDAVPTGSLAASAFIMSFYGPWAGREFGEKTNGGWCKFVAYADQSLRPRHALPEEETHYEDQRGLCLSIVHGLARVEFDVRERFGRYAYIGLATAGVVAAVRGSDWPRHPGYDDHDHDKTRWVGRCMAIAEALAATCRPAVGAASLIFDIGAVQGHPPKEKITPAEEQADGPARRPKGAGKSSPGGVGLYDGQQGEAG